MASDWEQICPELFKLHGPHLAPIWGMEEGPTKEALAELLGLLKAAPVRLACKEDQVLIDIQDEAWAVAHMEEFRRIEALVKERYDDIKRELREWL